MFKDPMFREPMVSGFIKTMEQYTKAQRSAEQARKQSGNAISPIAKLLVVRTNSAKEVKE